MEQTQQTIKMSSQDMRLSDQAIGSVMMALQKGLAEGVDITDVLRGFKIRMTEDGLFVLNPPLFKVNPENESGLVLEDDLG